MDNRPVESVRRSMVGAPPSASVMRDIAKTIKKEKKQSIVSAQEADIDTGDTAEDSESVKSGDTRSDEDEEDSAAAQGGSKDSTANEPPIKRRRKNKKRRFRLTDTFMRAKRKADRKEKLMAQKKEAGENEVPSEPASPSKKEKDVQPEEPPPKKPPLETFTPFQLLCDFILRKLVGKDPEEYFARPVDPSQAPNYFSIIKQPMDFSTIRAKIEQNKYDHLDEFRDDVTLIAENAMSYNEPNSVYYLAAQKLGVVAKYYFSEKYLTFVYYSAPFGKLISDEKVGFRLRKPVRPPSQHAAVLGKRKPAVSISDDLDAKELLKKVNKNLKAKLTDRIPNCHLAYLDNKDGALALNILTGSREEKSRVTLGDLVKPLDKGTPGLCTPFEPIICLDYPISYTNPGPFSSFAPQFNSTWATLSKRDSDFLFSCYRDKANVADALSLREMVAGAGDEAVGYVDDLLDKLTDGEHSKTIRDLKKGDGEKSPEGEKAVTEAAAAKDSPADARLIRTGTKIQELTSVQYNRLSTPPSTTLTANLPQPTQYEVELAGEIANDLVQQVQELGAKPGDLVSPLAIHHALGLDMDDLDVLREFMVV